MANKPTALSLYEDFGRLPSRLQDKAQKHGSFVVIATHTWSQKDEKASNLTYYPNDARWSDAEFDGFIIDLVSNYYDRKGLKGNPHIKAVGEVLLDIAKNGRKKII